MLCVVVGVKFNLDEVPKVALQVGEKLSSWVKPVLECQ